MVLVIGEGMMIYKSDSRNGNVSNIVAVAKVAVAVAISGVSWDSHSVSVLLLHPLTSCRGAMYPAQ